MSRPSRGLRTRGWSPDRGLRGAVAPQCLGGDRYISKKNLKAVEPLKGVTMLRQDDRQALAAIAKESLRIDTDTQDRLGPLRRRRGLVIENRARGRSCSGDVGRRRRSVRRLSEKKVRAPWSSASERCSTEPRLPRWTIPKELGHERDEHPRLQGQIGARRVEQGDGGIELSGGNVVLGKHVDQRPCRQLLGA